MVWMRRAYTEVNRNVQVRAFMRSNLGSNMSNIGEDQQFACSEGQFPKGEFKSGVLTSIVQALIARYTASYVRPVSIL